FASDARQVRIKFPHVRIGLFVDGRAAAAHVQNRRRWDAQLRRPVGYRGQVLKIFSLKAPATPKMAGRIKSRRRARDFLITRPKLTSNTIAVGGALLDAYAFDLSQKVCVPNGATIFAVRDGLQADLFLQLRHVSDRAVFDFPQGLGGESSLLILLASAQKFRRPQQAADMIGAKRWSPVGHRILPFATIFKTVALIIATFES